MAKFNPPSSFSFDKLTEWTDWKQRFQRFCTAAKLDKEDGEVQVRPLVYAMGSEAENIYKSFVFAREEQRNYFEIVLGKFNKYFFPEEKRHSRTCMLSPASASNRRKNRSVHQRTVRAV